MSIKGVVDQRLIIGNLTDDLIDETSSFTIQAIGVAPPTCTIDADCPEGYVCQDGICIEIAPPPCTIDADCPTGYVCQSGVCVKAPPPPFNWLPIILLALIGGVAVTAVAAYYT